jgi:hypothetical protein
MRRKNRTGGNCKLQQKTLDSNETKTLPEPTVWSPPTLVMFWVNLKCQQKQLVGNSSATKSRLDSINERAYTSGMNRDSMQPWQAEVIFKSLYPSLNYLSRLRRQMEQVGFPLYQSVSKAYDAMLQLRVEVHYLSCRSGVGRPNAGNGT